MSWTTTQWYVAYVFLRLIPPGTDWSNGGCRSAGTTKELFLADIPTLSDVASGIDIAKSVTERAQLVVHLLLWIQDLLGVGLAILF